MAPAAPNPISVGIVEDDPGIRESLAAYLDRARGFRCLGAFPDAESALRSFAAGLPEVVLMDINLPGQSGIEATRALKRQHEHARIVMLTVYEDGKALFDSLKAGACGYLLKRTPPEKILEGIRDAHAGGLPLNPQMGRHADELETLTQRERQTLELLAEGFLYKEIGARMGVKPETIHQFTKRIYEKLHVHNRTEAVVKFLNR
jgi:DNA-binding NarL/FixJ family response regulator